VQGRVGESDTSEKVGVMQRTRGCTTWISKGVNG
jgi:hypothetical protein